MVEEAESSLSKEAARSKAGSCPDPSSSAPPLEKLGLTTLKAKFPFLAEYTDTFIMEAGVHNLIKAEKAARQLKDMDRNSKAEDKLFSNRESLDSVLYPVESGQDNRISTLHPARCLPGAACSAGKLRLHARTIMGNKGHPPLSSYDLQTIGLGGSVSAKGWVEIHDPSSSALSIKMFSMNNNSLASKGGKDSFLQDMEDLSEFRNALRVLRGAMSFVHPWNHSINSLESFLVQSNYCSSDLAGSDKQVNTLVKFTDYVLAENASRWRDKEVFLSTRDIRGVWVDFFSQNSVSKAKQSGSSFPAKSFQPIQQQASGHFSSASGASSGLGARHKPGLTHPSSTLKVAPYLFLEDICVMYNLGRCIKAPGACTDKKGRKLRHVCNHRPDPNKPHESCWKNHAACLFH